MIARLINQLRAASLLTLILASQEPTHAALLKFQTAKEITGQALDFRFVSMNGKTLAGTLVQGGHAVPYAYSDSGGLTILSAPLPKDIEGTWAHGVSADGSMVFGHMQYSAFPNTTLEGFVWKLNTGITRIGHLNESTYSIASAMSRDGNILIGQSETDSAISCIYWNKTNGLNKCSALYPDFPADMRQPVHVSNDALTVWGNGYGNGFTTVYWRQGSPPVRFADLPGGNNSVSVSAVTGDAKFAFGASSTAIGYVAVQFDESGGTTPLFPSPTFQSWANNVTTDGRMVVGYIDYRLSQSFMSATESFIRDRKTGKTTMLSDFLEAYVPATTGWKNLRILDMSGDGNIMIGEGIDPEENNTSWILEGARDYLIPMDEPLAIHASKRLTLNRQTGLYDQKITINNRSPFEIAGYEILVSNLPSGVRLNDSQRRKDSVHVVRVETKLAPGASEVTQLHYHNRHRERLFHPKVSVVPMPSDPS